MRLGKAQLQLFEAIAREAFIDDMVEHLLVFNGPLCRTLARPQLRAFVVEGVVVAEGYGFSHRGSVRLLLELMVIFGCHFVEDPQYSWAGELLSRDNFANQMFKAGRLQQLAMEYLRQVHGPGGAFASQALLALHGEAQRRQPLFGPNTQPQDVVVLFEQIFPTKMQHHGPGVVGALLQQAETDCRGMTGQAHGQAFGVLATMMLCVGGGCLRDPFYAWIGKTLRRRVDAEARGEQLERRARIWLDAVLVNTDVVGAAQQLSVAANKPPANSSIAGSGTAQ